MNERLKKTMNRWGGNTNGRMNERMDKRNRKYINRNTEEFTKSGGKQNANWYSELMQDMCWVNYCTWKL